ncbi:MAG: outer membrane beta-barrel protein [Rhizobiaceae bacterium]
MTQFKRIFLGAAALFAATPALAADYDPPIVVDQAPEYQPVEIGNGWYLRGDVGYAVSVSTGTVSYRTFTAPNTYGAAVFDTARISTGLNYGVGFGYRFTDYLRADFTGERINGRFAGTTTSATPCLPTAPYVGTTCRSEDASSFVGGAAMVNAYADLGTISGFTPYVGAGAGLTYLRWNSLTNSTFCVDGGVVCPAGLIATTAHDGNASWRFTWALMAGMSYDMTKNTKLDFGYKYRRVSGGNMFQFDAASVAAGASGVQGTDSGFSQHEFKVGLRYELW